MKFLKIAAIASALALSLAGTGFGQTYPEKPITLIVPFPPGGSSDIVARAVSEKLSADLGQPIVVENRAGASGAIGAALTARAKPDGYTFMVGSIGVLSINPWLYKGLAYNPATDFTLLTQAVRYPNVLVVHPSFPANTMTEFVAYMKANPKKVVFASSAGASDQLTAHLFFQRTGTSGVDVTYKGSGPAITDLIGGHAQASFRNYGEVLTHIQSGQLKLLAVTSEARIPAYPDIPTMAEAGIPDAVVYSWQGFAAPKGLPADVQARLETALIKALKNPDVTGRLKTIGLDVVANTGQEFTSFQTEELARWKKVIEAGNIEAN